MLIFNLLLYAQYPTTDVVLLTPFFMASMLQVRNQEPLPPVTNKSSFICEQFHSLHSWWAKFGSINMPFLPQVVEGL